MHASQVARDLAHDKEGRNPQEIACTTNESGNSSKSREIQPSVLHCVISLVRLIQEDWILMGLCSCKTCIGFRNIRACEHSSDWFKDETVLKPAWLLLVNKLTEDKFWNSSTLSICLSLYFPGCSHGLRPIYQQSTALICRWRLACSEAILHSRGLLVLYRLSIATPSERNHDAHDGRDDHLQMLGLEFAQHSCRKVSCRG